jgi:excinuclease ABC subunit C
VHLEEYSRAVGDVKLLLSGKTDELVKQLHRRMNEAADNLYYEAAAMYRDWISMVREMSERQKMILEGQDDTDLFGYFQEGSRLALEVFVMRGGRVWAGASSTGGPSVLRSQRVLFIGSKAVLPPGYLHPEGDLHPGRY